MRIGKKFFIATASFVAAVGAVVIMNVTGTGIMAASNPCTADQIIRCGVTSTADLLGKYDRNEGDIQNIYRHYGISRDDIAGKTSVMKLGTVMRNGDVVVDNKVVATGAYSVSRIKYTSVDTGREPRAVPINGTTYYEGPDMGTFKKGINSVSVFVYMRDGQFHKAILDDCANPLIAVPVPPTPKPPVYACESLVISKTISRTEFQFTATASAENATIKSYTFKFGDGNEKVVPTNAKTATATHKYADKKANYTAEVIVTMSDGSTAKPNQKCKVPVEVKEKPVEDKPSIDIVKTVNGKEHDVVAVGTEFTYEITVRNTGNVALKNAVVTDNAPKEVTLLSASAGKIDGNKWTHTIPELKVNEKKSFTIKAKYATYAKGTHKNTVCVDTPTVPGSPDDCDDATTETKEPIKVCDLTTNTIKTIERSEFDESTMTLDLTKCGEIEVCIIKDKIVKVIPKNEFDESTMTTDLSKCDEEPVTPPELPKTGIGAFVSGSLGFGSITAASYYWVASRRTLLSAFLGK